MTVLSVAGENGTQLQVLRVEEEDRASIAWEGVPEDVEEICECLSVCLSVCQTQMCTRGCDHLMSVLSVYLSVLHSQLTRIVSESSLMSPTPPPPHIHTSLISTHTTKITAPFTCILVHPNTYSLVHWQ